MLTKSTEEATIEFLAKRSDTAVKWMALLFAVGGGVLDIVSRRHFGSSPFGGVGTLWGMWIPFCFLIIPPVHYLARYVLRLERHVARLKERVAALEAREVTTHVVGTPGEPTL